MQESRYLKGAAAADDAWIVLHEGQTDPALGVIRLEDVVSAVRQWQGQSHLVKPTVEGEGASDMHLQPCHSVRNSTIVLGSHGRGVQAAPCGV